MPVHRYIEPFTIDRAKTIRFVTVADDGTISELQTAAYEFPQVGFSAQPSVLSGATLTYGTYDPFADDVSVTAGASATVTDRAVLREAANALVSAGVSAQSAQAMLEQVFAAAQATTPVTATMQQVDSLLAQIAAFPTVTDILNLAVPKLAFLFTEQPNVVDGVIHYGTADTEADDVVSVAGTAATVTDIMTRVEQAIATAQAVPSVADLMAQIDNAVSTAQAEVTVADTVLRAVAESLMSASKSLVTVADRQMMVNGVTSVAASSMSLTAVASYLDRLTASATVTGSVTDVLTHLLDVGPHMIVQLNSPIVRELDLLSPITREVDLVSSLEVM